MAAASFGKIVAARPHGRTAEKNLELLLPRRSHSCRLKQNIIEVFRDYLGLFKGFLLGAIVGAILGALSVSVAEKV